MNTETLHLILSAGLVARSRPLDVAANLMLARSDGFKKRLIGIAALALVGLAFYCLLSGRPVYGPGRGLLHVGQPRHPGHLAVGWLFRPSASSPPVGGGMMLIIS